MPEVIKITAEHTSNLYDAGTQKSCVTEKVVDVTDSCPGLKQGRRAFFLYTRDRNGQIIQLVHPYQGEAFMGTTIHFHIARMEGYSTLEMWAREMGLTTPELVSLVKTHAPA